MTTEDKELHNDLVAAWNEVETVLNDLNKLTTKELIVAKPAIKRRLEDALAWLSKYVSEDDEIEDI